MQDDLVEPDRALVDSLVDESRQLQSIIDDLQVLALVGESGAGAFGAHVVGIAPASERFVEN